jgi:hypothetical protein
METILSLCLGIGLSAACGFRVFVPFLIMSLAAWSGHLTLAPGFQWIGSYPALVTFSAATILEIAGYYIPWLDHLLDTLATPAAAVAGTIITASCVADMSPFLKWTLAVIAGGGTATMIQASTVLLRGASTLATGGLGNPVFATAELTGAVVTSTLSIAAPVLTLALILVAAFVLGRKVVHLRERRVRRAAV